MFPLTSICYDGKDLEEPLGGMPTVSLVLQVTINTSYICIRKIPYCLYLEFFEIRNNEPTQVQTLIKYVNRREK